MTGMEKMTKEGLFTESSTTSRDFEWRVLTGSEQMDGDDSFHSMSSSPSVVDSEIFLGFMGRLDDIGKEIC